MIRLPNVWVIFRKEILDLLRDKRTVYGMLVLPIVIYPLLLVLFSQVLLSQTQKLKEQKYKLVLVGADRAPELAERIRKEGSWEVQESAPESPGENDERLMKGDAHVVIVVPPDFVDAIREDRSARVEVRFNNAKDESIFAQQRAEKIVEEYGKDILRRRLTGKPEGFERPVDTVPVGVAPPEKAGAWQLGRLLAMLLVLMTAVSAFYPSVDMASGEKERGTMETLLVSPALRSEIVLGKYFAVATVGLVTASLHLASMGFTFSYFFRSMLGNTGLNFSINLGHAFLALLPMVPLTLFFSALCLGLSAFARSYKEAMVYLTPVMIVANVCAFSALVPGIEFNYALALIPVQNCAMLTVQLLSGEFHWGHIFATVASSSLYALVALRWTWSIFQREDVLLRGGAEFDWKQWLRTWGTGVPGLGHALGAVVIMMALQIVLAGRLAGASVHKQLFVQQVFLIALPGAALAAFSSLNFRVTFRLRAPRLSHAIAAPLLALSGVVLATHLNNLLAKLEFFRQGATEHTQNILERLQDLGAFPLQLAFMSVLPALCEEFLFRGLVLTGLRRDLGRWPGILACGALFGIVHQVPISVVTVGLFGILLSWIALRSASLVPGILAHAVWNACLLASTFINPERTPRWLLNGDSPGIVTTAVAVLLFAFALWLVLRSPAEPSTEESP